MKIAIYGHYFNENTQQYVEDLLNALQAKNATIYIETSFLKLINSNLNTTSEFKTFNSYKDLDNTFDLFFTIGGDGTVLRSITYLRDLNIPIVGINIGRLAFLALVKNEKILEALEAIAINTVIVKDRPLLT